MCWKVNQLKTVHCAETHANQILTLFKTTTTIIFGIKKVQNYVFWSSQ